MSVFHHDDLKIKILSRLVSGMITNALKLKEIREKQGNYHNGKITWSKYFQIGAFFKHTKKFTVLCQISYILLLVF